MDGATKPFGPRDAIVGLLTVFLLATGIAPHDRLTWILEISWVAAAIVLWFAWLRRVRATRTLFGLLVAHAVVLIVGGYYTYALVPVGEWVEQWTGRPRNDYDRFGHFMQGLAPAILWREVFVRMAVVPSRRWLFVIVNGMCLAFSAAFELLEFAAAMTLGEASWAYLGSQGDVWDAHWDMLWCIVGANTALLTFARCQDREIAREQCGDALTRR